MSSTTERQRQRGQVLVLFAGGIAVLIIIAALAFDVGMMLVERRDQQNAADAAALAGARFVQQDDVFHGNCGSTGGIAAVVAACEVALANGFDHATSEEDVFVDIPAVTAADGRHEAPGFLEVRIAATRASIFGGIIGRAAWPVGVYAIAANQQDITYPFGMLALDETTCKAMQFAGTGIVNVNSSMHSNSTGEGCGSDPDAQYGLSQSGGADVNVMGECRSAGDIQEIGSGDLDCADFEEDAFQLPDPLRDLEAPDVPPLALGLKEWVAGTLITPTSASLPNYCPGKTTPANRAPEENDPQLCVLGNGSDAGRVMVLSPGLYPGGLDLRQGTYYLLPGIYYIGGGGLSASNDANIISVDDELDTTPAVCTTGATPPCVGGGGVLIYNSELPYNGGAAGKVTLGGGGATLSLMPFDYPWADAPDGSGSISLVIWQDRNVSLGGDDVTLNGSTAAATSVRGIVYLPEGDVKVNGSTSEFTMDQIIAQTFYVSGSGGTMNVLREFGIDAVISAAGLVE